MTTQVEIRGAVAVNLANMLVTFTGTPKLRAAIASGEIVRTEHYREWVSWFTVKRYTSYAARRVRNALEKFIELGLVVEQVGEDGVTRWQWASNIRPDECAA